MIQTLSDMKQARVVVKGQVIGVGFRNWTRYHAKRFGIRGWVKNVGDQVEALLQAEHEHLEKVIKKLRQGPPISNVSDVEVVWEDLKETHEGFKIVK